MSSGESPGLTLSDFPSPNAVTGLSSRTTCGVFRVKEMGEGGLKVRETPDTEDVGMERYSQK